MNAMQAFVPLILAPLLAPPAPLSVLAARPAAEVRAVAVAPDGSIVAGATADRAVRLWDLPGGKERCILKLAAPVSEVAFAPDGTRLATLSRGMEIWDPRSGARTMSAPTLSAFQMAYAAGGALAVAAHRVRIVDAATAEAREEFGEQGGWLCTCLAFSPDGKRVATGDTAGNIWVWDTATRAQTLRRKGHANRVTGVGFIDEGRTLVSGGSDGRMKFWDLASGREVGVLFPHPSAGLGRGIGALACSFDGRMIVTGGADDGTVKLWETASGRLRAVLPVPGMSVTTVGIALDGSTVAVGGKRGGGAVLAWRLYGCAPRLGVRVDGATWQQLGGEADVAYRAILALASNPRGAVALLKQRLRPVVLNAAVRQECDGLIAALESDQFDMRDDASRRLEAMSPWIEKYLKQALARARTLELRRRLQSLLARAGQSALPVLRVVEAMEHAPGTEARDLLRALAAGEPAARITTAAQQALQRRERLEALRRS